MKNKLLKKIVGWFDYKIITKDHFKNQRLISQNSFLNLENVLKNLFYKNRMNFIIQIGANDGNRFDILNSFIKDCKVNSLLVEPVIENFNSLKRNYSGLDFVKFENSAISLQGDILNLYKVKMNMIEYYEKKYGEHIRGISSVYKKHLIKHGIKNNDIEKIKINTLTTSELLKKHNILNFDLLFIDAEGYDASIAIDFLQQSKLRPIIILEYIHVKNKKFITLIDLLKINNFIYFIINENLVCFPSEKKHLLELN